MSGSTSAPYANANKPTVELQNPLDTFSKTAGLVNTMNVNKLYQANALRGTLMQQAVDEDGNYSPTKFNTLAAQAGPDLGPSMPAAIGQSQELQGQQLDQSAKRNAALTGLLTGALSVDDAHLHDAAAAAMGQAVESGLLLAPPGMTQQQFANQALAKLPSDPTELRQRLEQRRISLLPPDQQQAAIYGTRPQVNTGGKVQFPVIPPASQGGTPSLDTTVTPEVAGSKVTWTDDKGVEQQGTYAQYAIEHGAGRAVGGAAPAQAPTDSSVLADPSLPSGPPLTPAQQQSMAPLMPGSKAAPAQPARSGYTATQGPKPGLVEAGNTAGHQSAEAFKGITDQGIAAQSRGAVLDNMLADTSQFTTGPGADAIAKLRAIGNRLRLNVDTEGLSAAESFKKLAAALNSNQGSDARLSVSEASNPHADLSPAGIDLMLRQLRGNEDYLQARAKLASTYPDLSDNRGFEAKVGSKLDPRTFQYDRMSPPQKATFFKSLSDKDKFIKAHDAASALLSGGQ